jgi:gamma-glutamyltranspeptidase/glutathione hydrolase
VTGHLAVGIPGSVAGLWAAHKSFGSKPWKELIEPAIQLAEAGFEVDNDFERCVAIDAKRLAQFPATAALFLPGGKPLVAGARWRNPDLAGTLRLIATMGPAGFYKGVTADRIVAEMQRAGGIVTRKDLEAYQPTWRDPVIFTYRGHKVVTMPPPSSGGLTLALIAHQLEAYDLRTLGWRSPEAIHLQAEAMRRAFAVRNQILGDPDFVTIPQTEIVSNAFADRLRASISMERATPSKDVLPGVGPEAESKHTTHLSVADHYGNVVALTTTLNWYHGSGVVVPGAGFLLNDEMDDFTSKPGAPNIAGLVQGEANAIAPGKRMLSSMTPTIVLNDHGEPLLVTGASGSALIITTVFQLLSNLVDYGIGVSASVNAPRMHHQHLPDQIGLEKGGFDAKLVRALEKKGHRVKTLDFWSDGWTVSATIERRNGQWYGSADPRLHSAAEGH